MLKIYLQLSKWQYERFIYVKFCYIGLLCGRTNGPY